MTTPIPLFDPMVPAFARISRVDRELPDVFTWHLAAPSGAGFSFAPGQFNMLYAFGAGEVPISISGDPNRPEELVHTIRAVGAVTRAMQGLRKGDTIGVRGPFGSAWPLAEARDQDLLFVAGGLGVAPLRPAILHALAARSLYRRVIVLAGFRSPADFIFRKELERWRSRFDVTVEVTVDRADTSFRGTVAVVPALIAEVELDPAATVALLCGPEVMMRFAVRELERRGVPHERIHVSMERSMKCGVGFCGHCQYGPTFVCKDGPVYRFDRIERLFYVREI
ncbi:FAD/NAD(P)-binding protein [Nannocystis bainbridge]|uniref:FAD/NAD(P)-binding protein n=1 Tax=Nannocystis bainbridge TaxID=2995303 RepID=A0ABT5E4S1_9BACT|nr:FAD/NAD(P)-binding protein [Nannocystis bainbridge]MDC0720865.1 FAD/NAD(P)-binding protein [Nannocystis bainbridge]